MSDECNFMIRLILNIFTVVMILGAATPSLAQEQAAEPATPPESICETDEHFRDFDFWVGEWNVYANDEEQTFQGTNSVTRQHDGCLLVENWTSARGGGGSSMNYYDPLEGRWRQLWVAGGYSIDYTGSLDDGGSMFLNGKINYYKTGRSFKFRGTWTPRPDGSVRQFFEQHDPERNAWTVWFDGLYVRK
jgi:hypothetical protein